MTSSTFLAAAALIAAATIASLAAAADAFAVFKSNDRGQSWKRSDVGLPGLSRINAFGSAKGILFAGTDSGIFTSKDEGLRWQPATGAAVSSGRVISFATLSSSVFAGTDNNGLVGSSDGGASWALDRSFPTRKVRCLLAHGGKVYAGTDADGVFASNDAGQPWTQLLAGLPSHAQVFAMTAVRGRLFAGLYGQGLYAWDEQKLSWGKTGNVKPLALASAGDTLIAGHNPGGIHWSKDLGAAWSKAANESHAPGSLLSLPSDDSDALSPEAPVWEIVANDGMAIAGVSAGIYYSENGGRTWTRARKGLPAKSPGIAFLVRPDFVLAAALIKGSHGEPGEAAGGSQTIRPETNRTSSAAGPPP